MASTVDITSFPTARNDATEDKWTKYAQALISNGVLSRVANELEVFADSTGMVVKVKTGRCYIDGFAGDLAAQQSLDIAAADPTNPRLDRVVARLTTTSPATVSIRVLTGMPAGSPSLPALLDDATHTDIALASVRVEALAGTIAAGKVTDQRPWVQVGSSTLNSFRTEFRGNTSAPAFIASNGTEMGSIGLKDNVTAFDDDLVWYTTTGDLCFMPGGTQSVVFPAASGDVAISVQGLDVDMAGGGIFRFTSAATTSTATNGGGAALPGTPAGYLKIKVNGAERKLPFWNS